MPVLQCTELLSTFQRCVNLCFHRYTVQPNVWTPLSSSSFLSALGLGLFLMVWSQPLVFFREIIMLQHVIILDNLVLPTLFQLCYFQFPVSTWQCPCAESQVHKEMLFLVWCGRAEPWPQPYPTPLSNKSSKLNNKIRLLSMKDTQKRFLIIFF